MAVNISAFGRLKRKNEKLTQMTVTHILEALLHFFFHVTYFVFGWHQNLHAHLFGWKEVKKIRIDPKEKPKGIKQFLLRICAHRVRRSLTHLHEKRGGLPALWGGRLSCRSRLQRLPPPTGSSTYS